MTNRYDTYLYTLDWLLMAEDSVCLLFITRSYSNGMICQLNEQTQGTL